MATLNYDNGVELLARSRGVPLDTGIDEWSKTGNFALSGDGLALLKLHGSIDWALERDRTSSERRMPHSTISQVDQGDIQKVGFRPAIVFGQRNKLTAEGPFLDMLRAFRQELLASEVLTVIGYSFRDPHVNEYISQWLNESPHNRMRIVDPNFQNNQQPYAQALRNFAIDRIDVISQKASEGLKQRRPHRL